MAMNSQGRQTRAANEMNAEVSTHTGNKALQIEEPLIFERGAEGGSGVDLPEPEGIMPRLGVGVSSSGDLFYSF